MINAKVNEETLLNLFMDRLKYWTTSNDVLELYENYLKVLIDDGYFDGSELDIKVFINNFYINDTTIMDKKELLENDIDVDDSDKVLAKNEDKNLYLVSAY